MKSFYRKKKHMRKYSNNDIRHRSPNEDVLQGKKKHMINEDVLQGKKKKKLMMKFSKQIYRTPLFCSGLTLFPTLALSLHIKTQF